MIGSLQQYVDEIQFSLDGATPEINDQIRGRGVFEKVINSINLLRNTGIKLRLGVVLMPKNIKNFQDHIESFSNLVRDVEIKFGFANIEGRANESFRFNSPSEGEEEVQKILEIVYRKKLNVMSKYDPNMIVRNCGYGEVIAVSSDGDIFPCSILKPEAKAGNIRTNKLSDILILIKNNRDKCSVDNLDKCPQCDLKYICFGGCRLNNLSKNKNLLIPVCSQERKYDMLKRLIVRDRFDAIGIWLNQS